MCISYIFLYVYPIAIAIRGGYLDLYRRARGRPPRGLGRPHCEGHRRRRGAWGRPRGLGGHGLGERGGVLNVIKDEFLKYKGETEMREIPKTQGLTRDLPCIFTFFTENLK